MDVNQRPLSLYIAGLRLLAAVTLLLAGALYIAGLWLHNLSAASLLGATFGAAYLFVALGLFGQSSFSVYLALALPPLHRLNTETVAGLAQQSALARTLTVLDWLVPALCLIVLALMLVNHYRREPGVAEDSQGDV